MRICQQGRPREALTELASNSEVIAQPYKTLVIVSAGLTSSFCTLEVSSAQKQFTCFVSSANFAVGKPALAMRSLSSSCWPPCNALLFWEGKSVQQTCCLLSTHPSVSAGSVQANQQLQHCKCQKRSELQQNRTA